MGKFKKNMAAIAMVICFANSGISTALAFGETSINGKLRGIASYSTGFSSEDGGVAEIVKFNAGNKKIYLVNGMAQSVDIIGLKDVKTDEEAPLALEKRLDIGAMAEANGFTCGDITSVAVSTERKFLVIAVHAEKYSDNGYIVVLDYDGNYIKHFNCGVQPDMITVSKDGNLILTADEGEPREGYGEGAVNPEGSVTIVDLSSGMENAAVTVLDFAGFDSSVPQLVSDKVLLKPDTLPSVDLEPEYIAISENGKLAYVSLQEANAIATVDLAAKRVTSVKGLGYKDHGLEANALDALEDNQFKLSTHNLYGVYMPDSVASMTAGGADYVLTANEGDAREWGEYEDAGSRTIDGTEHEIDIIKNSERLGFEADKAYIYGARSFSIWNASTMQLVYDSGSDFERITGELYPDYFNSSHGETELDSRSGSKGPEPEEIQLLKADGKTYAFIGLERIGGVMVYDVTEPSAASFCDYINIRNFSGQNIESSGPLGPESICVIEAADSPTGSSIIVVANEVSGTVDIFEFEG